MFLTNTKLQSVLNALSPNSFCQLGVLSTSGRSFTVFTGRESQTRYGSAFTFWYTAQLHLTSQTAPVCQVSDVEGHLRSPATTTLVVRPLDEQPWHSLSVVEQSAASACHGKQHLSLWWIDELIHHEQWLFTADELYFRYYSAPDILISVCFSVSVLNYAISLLKLQFQFTNISIYRMHFFSNSLHT